MSINLTPEQARALGIDVPAARARTKTTRKAVPSAECSATRCVTCDETFPTQAAEDRHHATTRHAQYRTVLEVLP